MLELQNSEKGQPSCTEAHTMPTHCHVSQNLKVCCVLYGCTVQTVRSRSCCGRDCLVGLGLRLTVTMSGYVEMLSRVCAQAMMAFAVPRAQDGVHHVTGVFLEVPRRIGELATSIDRSHLVEHELDRGLAPEVGGCETIGTCIFIQYMAKARICVLTVSTRCMLSCVCA